MNIPIIDNEFGRIFSDAVWILYHLSNTHTNQKYACANKRILKCR